MNIRTAGTLVAFVAGIATVQGCATQTPAPESAGVAGQGQCFRPSDVMSYRAVDDDTVNVQVGANDVYSVDLAGPCPGIDWSLQISLQSATGSPWVCGGHDAVLLVPSSMGTMRCPVTNIQKLSPEAAKAARSRS